jgi:hypothetical protein
MPEQSAAEHDAAVRLADANMAQLLQEEHDEKAGKVKGNGKAGGK